ncbi:predicted protein [Histoplasma capsulatum var. duboisii H88]|uniref:Predicted protein n=2 Tax=Ajellomyces capsulatus TaxID=5037 RepID=F0UW68_AJEC8|nr:predicted protein [Histoplasma capsulatum H143]EGC42578.1 predicted protein [Histoplasma capsulatum var. duboisii H88]
MLHFICARVRLQVGPRRAGGIQGLEEFASSLPLRSLFAPSSPSPMGDVRLKWWSLCAERSYKGWPSCLTRTTSSRGRRGVRGTPSHSHTLETRSPPPPASHCDASANALLPCKHGLPLKPPAEVCVPISSNVHH